MLGTLSWFLLRLCEESYCSTEHLLGKLSRFIKNLPCLNCVYGNLSMERPTKQDALPH